MMGPNLNGGLVMWGWSRQGMTPGLSVTRRSCLLILRAAAVLQSRRANAIKVDSRELERGRRASLVAFQIDVALLEGTADEPVGCFGLRAELAGVAERAQRISFVSS